MSLFVVYAKPVSRLRAATYRAGCQAEKVRGCSSVTEAMTLNSTILYCLRMCCCYNDPLFKAGLQFTALYSHIHVQESVQPESYGGVLLFKQVQSEIRVTIYFITYQTM